MALTEARNESLKDSANPQVRSGYTSIDGSVIPDDWDVVTLKQVCRAIVDGTHFTPSYVDAGVPFYSVENVTSDDFTNTKFISRAEHEKLIKRCRPEQGDILLTRIGSLGETKLIDWVVDASIYVSLALLKPSAAIDRGYLYAYTKSRRFVRDVENRALLNAAPKKINMGEIGGVPILVPRSRSEQRSIAAAVSDTERMIATLDDLIAKKRTTTRGSMQQLLTGRTRLPGFRDAWTERELGSMLKFLRHANNPRRDLGSEGGIQYLHYGDVHAHPGPILDCRLADLPWIDAGKVTRIPYLVDGDLILADASEDLAGIAKSVEIANVGTRQIVSGLHTIVARGVPGAWASGFKAYLQFIPDFKQALERAASGISVYAISKRQIAEITLKLPPPNEQGAISAVLSDMQSEITTLESRRNKMLAIKECMLQQLLSGRVRLSKTEVAA